MPTITIGRSGNGNGGSGIGSSGGGSRSSGSRDYPSSSREGGDSRGVGSGSSSSRDVSSSYDEAVIKRNQAKISMSPHDYSQATVSGMDKHFVTSYDHGNGRLDINGFCHAGNQAVARVVEHLKYQAKQKEEVSGTGHTILAHKHTLNFSFNLMCDKQVANLAECLKWQKLDLLTLNLSYNNITCKGVDPLFYQLSTGIHFQPHNIQSINLSNCNIGDTGAEYIAQSLISGRYPATKYINLSGNKITKDGKGCLAKGIEKASQKIAIVLESIKSTSKDTFKLAIKGMIDVAKSNGISTKEALTTQETIEHCKKGTWNVGKKIGYGLVKCLTPADTPIALYEMDMVSLVVGTATNVLHPLKKPAQFVCVTQETFFSVVDEDFANCLTGLDSGLE